jgi:hypothetical protein
VRSLRAASIIVGMGGSIGGRPDVIASIASSALGDIIVAGCTIASYQQHHHHYKQQKHEQDCHMQVHFL